MSDMLEPDAVFASCPTGVVTGAWRTALARGFDIRDKVRPGQALAVWTADMLRRELPNHLDGVSLWVADSGVPEGTWADVAYNTDSPPPPLTITDGRLVWVCGTESPFDVSTGESAPKIDGDWFHVSVFNLRALYNLCNDRALKWTDARQKSGQTQTHPPSVS